MATPPSSPPSASTSPRSSPLPTTTTTTTHLLALPATSTQHHQSPPNPTPPKKPQPLPWTHEETITLIQTYQQKWYSLKKGQLKASQWEEVSLSVPSKTSTQCRHKMEKLRKRYRAERVKPYPNSWPYFQVMDSMERGPFPLNAQPVSALQMLPQPRPHGPLSYSSNFNSNDDSDGDDNGISHEVGVGKNKSKSINNIVSRGMGVVYSSNNGSSSGGIIDRNKRIPLVGGNERGMMPRVMMNSNKRREYEEDSDSDEEDEEVDIDGEGDDDGGAGDGGKELALEIRGFTERFMRVEKMKIEMMRETERFRLDMEKRRMEMILSSQRKILDTIGRAFRAHKRLNTGEEP